MAHERIDFRILKSRHFNDFMYRLIYYAGRHTDLKAQVLSLRSIGFSVILTHKAGLAHVKCSVTLNAMKKGMRGVHTSRDDVHNRTGEIVRLSIEAAYTYT